LLRKLTTLVVGAVSSDWLAEAEEDEVPRDPEPDLDGLLPPAIMDLSEVVWGSTAAPGWTT
jgi:hypothetical protein